MFVHSCSLSDVDVPFHVKREMVGAGEGSLAESALEGTIARVLPVVASQLVRARELPAATLPLTLVRLLARVRTEVSLEVRGLGVGLAAAGVVTGVGRQLLARDCSSLSLGAGLVQAVLAEVAETRRGRRRHHFGEGG